MQPSIVETQRVTTWERMRMIECELFLLATGSGLAGQRFELLCEERTQLANTLRLMEYRQLPCR